MSASARKSKLAAANKKSKGAPAAASSVATATVSSFPAHTFGRGTVSTAVTRNLGIAMETKKIRQYVAIIYNIIIIIMMVLKIL